ncbi:hypothetical protein B0H67DRAFT_640528 [Lasiosphaeris hirsuta]|uniref:DUF7580 domain-containing protein n=1 Tax=Lasiosphaeris hirsuta TaxID=260670 RepID=A0AA40BDM5_9PEZI|nr:hypothetical protein B0H67DRAFT_640528 [Lasiosphaeris hirsuta]
MSGIEVLGVVLGLIPVVARLAKQYEMMSGSGDLSRNIRVEDAMYDQTCRGLLRSAVSAEELRRLTPSRGHIDQGLWESPELRQKLLDRLGLVKMKLTLELLTEMRALLQRMKADLTNLCRGTAVSNPGMRERLGKIQELNENLRKVLDEAPCMATYHDYRLGDPGPLPLQPTMTGHSDQGARQFFEAVRGTYTCTCQTGHLIGVGCRCETCSQPFTEKTTIHTTNEWNYCLSLPTDPGTPGGVSVLLETVPHRNTMATQIRDICSFVRNASAVAKGEILIGTPDGAMTYRMRTIEASGTDVRGVQNFAQIIQAGELSTKEKLELALRLSLAVDRLYGTPWIDGSWTWNDVIYAKPPAVFILREVHSATYEADRASLAVGKPQPSSIDGEPVLTKLGLALIELALGKPIQKTKQYNSDELGQDFANIIAAKTLLTNGTIRGEWGAAYERVVNVCIRRIYIDPEGNARGPLSNHESFIPGFRDAIITPLFHEERVRT